MSESPTKEEIFNLRTASGLSKTDAGKILQASYRTWHQWETGARPMHPVFWSYFKIACENYDLRAALLSHKAP